MKSSSSLACSAAAERAVGGVGAHEAHQRDGPGLGEQPGDVRGAAHVLGAGVLVEAEVAVQPVTQVVAVEQEGRAAHLEQSLLDGRGDGRLAGAGQAREPERRAAVAELAPAPLARQPRALPADVGAALARAPPASSTSVSRITPAATVSLVASSIRIRLPVRRLRR